MASPRMWAVWIAFFLLLEVPSAIDGKKGGTLSELVWHTFSDRISRALLLVFLATLTCHLVLGAPSGLWIVLTGAPVLAVMIRRWM